MGNSHSKGTEEKHAFRVLGAREDTHPSQPYDPLKKNRANRLSVMYFTEESNMPLDEFARKKIYGLSNDALEHIPTEPISISLPSHPHASFTLAPDGTVRVLGDVIHLSGFKVINPTMYQRDGLVLLRGNDCETGLSFHNDSIRHFFCFRKQVPEKISLHHNKPLSFEHGNSGYLTSGLNFRYFLPVVYLPSNEIITLNHMATDPSSFNLSERVSKGPVVIVFPVSPAPLKEDYFNNLWPWITFNHNVGDQHLEKQILCVNDKNKKYEFPTQKPNKEKESKSE